MGLRPFWWNSPLSCPHFQSGKINQCIQLIFVTFSGEFFCHTFNPVSFDYLDVSVQLGSSDCQFSLSVQTVRQYCQFRLSVQTVKQSAQTVSQLNCQFTLSVTSSRLFGARGQVTSHGDVIFFQIFRLLQKPIFAQLARKMFFKPRPNKYVNF